MSYSTVHKGRQCRGGWWSSPRYRQWALQKMRWNNSKPQWATFLRAKRFISVVCLYWAETLLKRDQWDNYLYLNLMTFLQELTGPTSIYKALALKKNICSCRWLFWVSCDWPHLLLFKCESGGCVLPGDHISLSISCSEIPEHVLQMAFPLSHIYLVIPVWAAN